MVRPIRDEHIAANHAPQQTGPACSVSCCSPARGVGDWFPGRAGKLVRSATEDCTMRIGLSLLLVLAATAVVAADPPGKVDAKTVRARLKGEWREFDVRV